MKSLDFLNLPNPSSLTITAGMTKLIAGMSNRKFFRRDKARSELKADTLNAIANLIF
jgi:hypothetical protein